MSCLKRGTVVSRSSRIVILFVSLALYPCVAHTMPGDLDPGFGSNGIVTTIIDSGSETRAIAIQPDDGKIVVAGKSRDQTDQMNFTVARYDNNEILDITFGAGKGWVTTDFAKIFSSSTPINSMAYAVAIQPKDRKIVVVGASFTTGGSADLVLVRYNSDGTPDKSFGIKGGVQVTDIKNGTDVALGVAIQPNGKIVVAGTSYNGKNDDILVARYNNNGNLDTTFGNSKGWVTTDFTQVSNSPVPINSMAYAVAIQPKDRKIVVVGTSRDQTTQTNFTVARYNNNGNLDTTFGNGKGWVTTDFAKISNSPAPINSTAYAVAIQPDDGKIVVAGGAYNGTDDDTLVARYNNNGILDTTFGTGTGWVTTNLNKTDDKAYAIAIQPDRKIVVAGAAYNGTDKDIALVRYTPEGKPDTEFGGGNGWVTTDLKINEVAYSVAIQSDGKLVVAGSTSDAATSKIALARYMGAVGGTGGAATGVTRATIGGAGAATGVTRATIGGAGTTPGGTGEVTVEEPEAATAGEAEVVTGEVGVTAGESGASSGGEANASVLEGGGGCSLLPSLR